MRFPVTTAVALTLLMACSTASVKPDAAARAQLAPAGTLRLGVATAPSPSPAFAVLDPAQRPHGVPVTIAQQLARSAGVPLAVQIARNSGELTEWLAKGEIDLSFLPVDDVRKQRVDFGPDYFIFESTFLVRPGLNVASLAEVDRPGVRVIGISNTATIRAATRALPSNTITPVPTVAEAVEMLRSGQADAFAFSRDGLAPIQQQLPGSVILKEAFLRSSVAVALPKQRQDALAFVNRFIEEAKRSGLIRQAFVDAGLSELEVAPPSGR